MGSRRTPNVAGILSLANESINGDRPDYGPTRFVGYIKRDGSRQLALTVIAFDFILEILLVISLNPSDDCDDRNSVRRNQ